MTSGSVDLAISGGVASVLFNRPESHNAMTFAMYDRLAEACAQKLGRDPDNPRNLRKVTETR